MSGKHKISSHQSNMLNRGAHIAVYFLLLFSFSTRAQYYGAPDPIPLRYKTALLLKLKKTSNESSQISVLLDLSNLFYNKPFQRVDELGLAKQYALRASQLSKKKGNVGGFGKAQIRLAEILGEEGRFSEAEAMLTTVSGSLKIDMLLALSYKSFYAADDITDIHYKDLFRFAEAARDSAIKAKDKMRELLARNIIAYSHIYDNKPKIEEEFLNIIKELKAGQYLPVHHVYMTLNVYYRYHGLYDKEIPLLREAFVSIKKSGDSAGLGDYYGAVAGVYRVTSRREKSVEYAKLTISQFKIYNGRFGDRMQNIIPDLSSLLRSMKKPREALAFMLEKSKEFPAMNQAERARYDKEIGFCYWDLGNIKLAESFLLRAYDILVKNKQAFWYDHKDMAQFYIDTKRFAKANPYLERIFKVKQQLPVKAESHLQYIAFLTDSAAGNYKSAMSHLSRHNDLDNDYISVKRHKDIQDLNIKYETKQKEDKIKILNQNSAIEKAELQRSKLIRNVTFTGTGLLFVIAGLLFRQSAHRKKTNKLISNKNFQLEHLVKEKEWLLKEVHHRVKNNLHTVICLLESQAIYLKDDALNAIEKSQHRIYAMSLIHQKLYQSEDIKTVDMSKFLPEFISYLRDSLITGNRIRFELDIEPINLGVSYAVPLSLIINEAVTNSIKYAFPDNIAGIINISIHTSDNTIELRVEDNGVGIAPEKINASSNSLGLKLLAGLSEDIQGNFTIINDGGTKIRVLFTIESVTDTGLSDF
ncbi:sensor histidine kinase [Pedobacter sp. Leaf194]|uniref:tetratricopeptide repeat-containing sensor histidine kinase n=1 Tax=Pedobacter sp. Leaf194 TaxID=1736297 RepID=UPI0007025799|nr:sensor histidine kinase [Pedobacter sp. Leaf194]KQS36204.1 hypothetical protein ASG14_12290 [Pedobacter sp. Leaf194]